MTGFEKAIALFAPVTALLNDFVQMFDEEYSVALQPKFEANLDTEVIGYAVAVPASATEAFVTDFLKRFPCCSCFDSFTLSFMHELGHLETEWDIVDDTEERNTITDNETYFNLYNERIATDWAGEYLTENKEEMLMLERQILTELKKVWAKIPD